ncbi:T9SS type A sorting domain-containing protein [Adhaeribacter sp. BT258]|uniref:T9SS type A sorting domain-containing protein n=1 Tax=Adhaeribacter terrigena TaxID=2793070 RepID=A0ABS1C4N2_9BACT|nr:T9SS type A sorting domain-containing protein [Adhaeribacter terrigena]MBK0404327.1 T9SS type A sorting domain-containing protein [Adhaeribacter terrigena]
MKKIFTTALILLFALTARVSKAQFTANGDAIEISTTKRPHSFQLTADLTTQQGAVWSNTPIDLRNNSFTLTFSANFGSKDATGAEGMALVFQNDARGAAATVGGPSQYFGFQGIASSLNIEFDTNVSRGNSGKNAPDAIGLSKNTATATATKLQNAVQASTVNANIENGADHKVEVSWDALAQTLYVYFNGSLRQTYTNDVVNNIFGGNGSVYWGFTSSTESLSNQHRVYDLNISLTDLNNKVITPLPVSLVKFAAAKTDKGNKLTWATASEKNSAYFLVERSADAKNWNALTKIASQGNSSNIVNYEFTDASSAAGLLYYRLKMVDLDGTSEFSKVITIQSENQLAASVSVFPNPVQQAENLHLTFETKAKANVTIQLLDMMGTVVKSENQTAETGRNTYSLNMASVKPGMYLVQVASGSTKETKRVVVR